MMQYGKMVKINAGILLLAVVLHGGCASEKEIFREVRSQRQQAYRTWAHQRQEQQQELLHLGGQLSLQDAVNIGIVNNKALKAVAQQRDIAKGRIVESYSGLLPSVDLNANYTRLGDVASFDVGGRRVTTGYADNYSTDLVIRQPLYKGGSIEATLRTAKVFALYTDETIRAQYQRTLLEIATSYFETLLANRLYEANRDAVESARAQLGEVQARRELGLASEFDVLRAQVDVSNFTAEMIQQQNRVNLARSRLLKAMGVSQESEVELSDELVYYPFEIDLQVAVKTAFENRPDLYQAEYTVRLQEQALRIARTGYLPELDGVFTQSWGKPDPRNSTNNTWGDTWRAELQLDWPLFSGLETKGRVMQEKARLRQFDYELLDTQERALLEIRQAMFTLEDAAEFVDSQRLNLERASEGLRLAEVGYRQGVNTPVEVTDARSALTRARSLYYQAIHGHIIARLALQQAMGVLGRPEGPFAVQDNAVELGYEKEFQEENEKPLPAPADPNTPESLPVNNLSKE